MKHVHFIGIGGIGMSGLATILLQQGISVSGSDCSTSAIIEALRAAGASIVEGHQHPLPPGVDYVVVSSGIEAHNPELLLAQQLGYCVIHRSDMLAMLMKHKKPLLVTGTHGKTTTSSFLTYMLYEAHLDPSFAVGGIMPNFGTNAHHGSGDYFVAEADESDGTFLKYPYYGAIITNIDSDHLAHFGSMENLTQAFCQFAQTSKNPRLLFFCGDDPKLAQHVAGCSYGISPSNDIIVHNIRVDETGTTFDLKYFDVVLSDFRIQLLGVHNAVNASAVIGMALSLGIPEAVVRSACQHFKGVKRRLEIKDAGSQCYVRDDYAHHPTEIAATLRALRMAIGERRLLAVFQPHRPSRMQYTIHELPGAFVDADGIIVTDVYMAHEHDIDGVHSMAVFTKVKEHHVAPCFFCGRDRLVGAVNAMMQPDDVVIFLGAGDSTKAAEEVAALLKTTARDPWHMAILCWSHEYQSMASSLDTLPVHKYEITIIAIEKEDDIAQALSQLSSYDGVLSTIQQDRIEKYNEGNVPSYIMYKQAEETNAAAICRLGHRCARTCRTWS